jgi:membrane protease subunit (stomatin/prohibitin family)
VTLFDGLRRQMRSVIQWDNPAPEMLFERWTDNGDEIKNASKLIVGPGQGCIFVYEGKIEAVIEKECLVDLKTQNVPFWTTVSKFMQLFVSEHKVGIYYFRLAKVLDQKWGTGSPIRYDDPKYGIPVGLSAYGNYSFRIRDPRWFFVNVVGGAPVFTAEEFRTVMNDRIVHPLGDYLAEARHSYAEIDARRDEIAAGMQPRLAADFEKLGFEITDFRIEGTGFDPETVRRIGRIADVSAEAQAAKAAGLDYGRVQQLEAMREAARNEGGAAGAGLGLGAGIGLGQMMAGAMGAGGATQNVPGAAAPRAAGDPAARLEQLKKMLDAALITDEEYRAKKREILDCL